MVLCMVVVAAALGGVPDVNGDGCVNLADYAEMQIAWEGPECQPTTCEGGRFCMEMSVVPGEGAGPSYEFMVGVFEVSNAQFVAFLNDAHVDGGVTRRGSFMAFHPDGSVKTLVNESMFIPQPESNDSRIVFDIGQPLGERYFATAGFEDHPVVGVNWIGALKFCNWLTVDSGIPDSELAYTEWSSNAGWRPATITLENWQDRDLNDDERSALVMGYRGFRLAMDNVGSGSGAIGNQENPFNEWYKAAAFDVAGPAFERVGLDGEGISPFHWGFGYGRDSVTPSDGNYRDSLDPYDNGTTPVGFYDGVTWLEGQAAHTNDTNNAFGLYDMSGNVLEWMQDRSGGSGAVRGGAWSGSTNELSTTFRKHRTVISRSLDVGFRVVRVP